MARSLPLYFAIVGQVPWVQYGLIACVWWMLATSVIPLVPGAALRRIDPPTVPQLNAMVFDLGVLASMFLAHWYWTACAYAAYCGCVALVQARATSKP